MTEAELNATYTDMKAGVGKYKSCPVLREMRTRGIRRDGDMDVGLGHDPRFPKTLSDKNLAMLRDKALKATGVLDLESIDLEYRKRNIEICDGINGGKFFFSANNCIR